jgi:hypothetical protein
MSTIDNSDQGDNEIYIISEKKLVKVKEHNWSLMTESGEAI